MSMNGSDQSLAPVSVHQPVVEDRDPPTRRKMFFFDRLKVLVLLAIFLVAVLTESRGNDTGNVLAMIAGFAGVLFLSNGDLQKLMGFTTQNARGETVGALVLAFPWRIFFGTVITFAVAVCFRTPTAQIERTRERNACP